MLHYTHTDGVPRFVVMKSIWKCGVMSFLVVVYTFYPGALQASIGETEAQISARYGKPIYRKHGVLKNHRIYGYTFKKTYEVLVQFIDGVSQWEDYSVDGRSLSTEEVQVFLAMNSGGKHWRRSGSNRWSIKEPAQKNVGSLISATTGPGFPDLKKPGLNVSTGIYVMFLFEVMGSEMKKVDL